MTHLLGLAGELRCFHMNCKMKITAERQFTMTVVPATLKDEFVWAAVGEVFTRGAFVKRFAEGSAKST
jgi:hypothetical protein